MFVSQATLSVRTGEEQKVVVAHLSKFVPIKSLQVTVMRIHRLLIFFLLMTNSHFSSISKVELEDAIFSSWKRAIGSSYS